MADYSWLQIIIVDYRGLQLIMMDINSWKLFPEVNIYNLAILVWIPWIYNALLGFPKKCDNDEQTTDRTTLEFRAISVANWTATATATELSNYTH